MDCVGNWEVLKIETLEESHGLLGLRQKAELEASSHRIFLIVEGDEFGNLISKSIASASCSLSIVNDIFVRTFGNIY